MDDVTDITVNIDVSDDSRVPPDMLELGIGVTELQENTQLRVSRVEMDTDGGHPPEFVIEGVVLTEY